MLTYTAVSRDTDTQATLTVPATADYDITANEAIEFVAAASTHSGSDPITASGNLVVSNVTASVSGVGLSYGSTGKTYTHSATGINITIGQ